MYNQLKQITIMKTYIVPQTTESVVEINTVMTGVSGGITGAGWGGPDTEGTKDPAVKDREWDEM